MAERSVNWADERDNSGGHVSTTANKTGMDIAVCVFVFSSPKPKAHKVSL